MVLRAEIPTDQGDVFALIQAAFGQPVEARLVDELRRTGDLVYSFVAQKDDQLLGHIGLSRMTAPVAVLGLAPVSVLPAHQKTGIGSALITHAIDKARADGWQAIFVLGNPDYYGRFGFSVAAAAGFENTYAGPHFMALALHPQALNSGFVVSYAAAFDQL